MFHKDNYNIKSVCLNDTDIINKELLTHVQSIITYACKIGLC